MTHSFAFVRSLYLRARRDVTRRLGKTREAYACNRSEFDRITAYSTWDRKVSRRFHELLKRHRVPVECVR